MEPKKSKKSDENIEEHQKARSGEDGLTRTPDDGKSDVRATSTKVRPANTTTIVTSPTHTEHRNPLTISPPGIIPATPSDPTGPDTSTTPNSAYPTEAAFREVSLLLARPEMVDDTAGLFDDLEGVFRRKSRGNGSPSSDDELLDKSAKPAPLSLKTKSGSKDKVKKQYVISETTKTQESSGYTLRCSSGDPSSDEDDGIIAGVPTLFSSRNVLNKRLPRQPATVGIDAAPTHDPGAGKVNENQKVLMPHTTLQING
jgi:hypothetical protein